MSLRDIPIVDVSRSKVFVSEALSNYVNILGVETFLCIKSLVTFDGFRIWTNSLKNRRQRDGKWK